MKALLKLLILFFVKFFGRIFTYKVCQRVKDWKSFLYTRWISQFLGSVGDSVCIEPPSLLLGGGEKRVSIGNNTSIRNHSVLGCWTSYKGEVFEPEIIIGNNCWIGEYSHITAINKITIGDGLLTGRFVYIGDNSHGNLTSEESSIPPSQRHLTTKGEIKIGNNVWICDKVSILSGVTIGDNVIIGAGSIVTHDIPSNSVAAGMPARVIKKIEL